MVGDCRPCDSTQSYEKKPVWRTSLPLKSAITHALPAHDWSQSMRFSSVRWQKAKDFINFARPKHRNTAHSLLLMKPKLLILLFALGLPSLCLSQVRERTLLFGVGTHNVLDTYLSPLEYTGTAVSFYSSTSRPLRNGQGKWTYQHSCWGDVGHVANPTDDNNEWDGQFQMDWAWRHNWQVAEGWLVQVGPMVEFGMGFTYSLKGGNNPAQGRCTLATGASAATRYDFRLWKKEFQLNGRLDIPMLGMAFAPNYGQSYYEMFSLGHYDHNIVLTHPGNAPTARVLCTLSLPIGDSRLHIGYKGEARQSRLNHLKRHAWLNAFMIGYSYSFQKIRR